MFPNELVPFHFRWPKISSREKTVGQFAQQLRKEQLHDSIIEIPIAAAIRTGAEMYSHTIERLLFDHSGERI